MSISPPTYTEYLESLRSEDTKRVQEFSEWMVQVVRNLKNESPRKYASDSFSINVVELLENSGSWEV